MIQYQAHRTLLFLSPTVLQEVSPDEPAGKQVYDTAKAVYNGAQRLLETQYTEKKGGKSNTKNKKTLKSMC